MAKKLSTGQVIGFTSVIVIGVTGIVWGGIALSNRAKNKKTVVAPTPAPTQQTEQKKSLFDKLSIGLGLAQQGTEIYKDIQSTRSAEGNAESVTLELVDGMVLPKK